MEIRIIMIAGDDPFALPGTPHEELTKAFGRVAYGEYNVEGIEETIHVATVPDLYVTKSAHPKPIRKLREFFGIEPLFTVEPLVGLAFNKEDSAKILLSRAADAAMQGGLRIVQAREGQENPPLVIGRQYKAIQQDHPLHDHTGAHLADLQFVFYDPFFGFHKMGMDDNHSHFLIK